MNWIDREGGFILRVIYITVLARWLSYLPLAGGWVDPAAAAKR
jgi:hypothetical protein